jgi:hypothetical protein
MRSRAHETRSLPQLGAKTSSLECLFVRLGLEVRTTSWTSIILHLLISSRIGIWYLYGIAPARDETDDTP